jgi:hypothetical protein
LLAQSAVSTSISKAQRLVATYTAVRPILAAISVLPLVPANWRLGLRVFIEALDAFVVTPSVTAQEDFKAGKDL